MATLRFDSIDLARTEAFFSRAYATMRISADSERPHTRVIRQTLGSIDLDYLSVDFEMTHQSVEPIGKVCLVTVYSGGVSRQYHPDGTAGTFGPGDMFVYAPDDRTYSAVIHRARYTIVMFDPQILSEVAGAPGSGPRVRLTGDRPVSASAARQLQATIIHLRDYVLPDPICRSAPLAVAAASTLLAASVLSAFAHTMPTEPLRQTRRDCHPATVRRAIAYIEAHADEPVTLADIAAAAGTSGRAVQGAFRRHRGTTPMGYLRQVRLDGAHRELRAADPTTGDTVAAISARWGFGPAARFAVPYREQYGVLPSQTLRT